MQDLPPDVWSLVAENLPFVNLWKLISVNRAFFDLALDARYKALRWGLLNPTLIKLLDHLQNPSIARRVRRLYIHPWFIQYLFDRQKLFQQSLSQEEEERKLWSGWLKGIFNVTGKVLPSTTRTPDLTPDKIVNSMIKAVEGMVNVTEYEFEWRDMPLNPRTLSFLSSARSAFHANLSKLVIHLRLSRCNEILFFADFHSLSSLGLHFEYDPSSEPYIGAINEKVLLDSVAPFMTLLRFTLHSLTITSLARCDHSPFLRTLGPFPILRVLNLHIPVGTEHLSDPSAISGLLLRHKSFLTRLVLRPTCDEGSIKALKPWPAISALCMADTTWISNLDYLTFPALNLPTMVSVIQCTPSHLDTLCLYGMQLDFADTRMIVGLLGTRTSLRSLSLDIKKMNPELFTLLSNTLPALKSLSLVLEKGPYTRDHFEDLNYTQQTDWLLYDLAIYFDYYKEDARFFVAGAYEEYDVMSYLVKYVLPNVCSFKGTGHMLRLSGYDSTHRIFLGI